MTESTQVQANDVAAQFSYLPTPQAVTAIAGHLRMFWDPRMRAELRDAAQAGDESLDPLARAAGSLLH
jgi:formate dehydrogenase subunit delta